MAVDYISSARAHLVWIEEAEQLTMTEFQMMLKLNTLMRKLPPKEES